uniref:Poly [ADP-ribose] polymerase n=1 Tax=Neolamprologus brichardi TaxID=32507 RepID=A0A3Q4GDH1_NEOBR
MNQGQCRAQVVFTSDSIVYLVGHSKEVEELSDIVTQFILDQASVEGYVALPFPELLELLPDLLQLFKCDSSEVTLHPLTSSSRPVVQLEGPSGKVTEFRNKLGPLLQSLVRDRVSISMPGAVRFFEGLAGRNTLVSVGQSYKCLIQLEEQNHVSRQNSGVTKYNLCDGLQVLVCQGDITTQWADALVNAANEDLEHGGGVAAALSKAGGPQVQIECRAMVKQTGKIPTGPGMLGCKEIIHVGFNCDPQLIRKYCKKILVHCENKGYNSVSFPAINTALEMPIKWDPMQEELFMKVELQPTSQEYREIAQGFLKTAKFNICKIERVQNLYLWNAYSVCKQRILAKNGPAELGEKTLYHGTTAESCQCIERDRFDRGHAGKHAAKYGKGVYFAVNAAYSANGFSPADKSGLKRMYVVRVLTGRYTVGKSSMISPPPRGSDPTDCYDSLVDNQQQPNMFVIFHDDQAYPEYLITFK